MLNQKSGWGRDYLGLCFNNGEKMQVQLSQLTGFEIALSASGPDGWGAPWNEMIGWGGDLTLSETTQLSICRSLQV